MKYGQHAAMQASQCLTECTVTPEFTGDESQLPICRTFRDCCGPPLRLRSRRSRPRYKQTKKEGVSVLRQGRPAFWMGLRRSEGLILCWTSYGEAGMMRGSLGLSMSYGDPARCPEGHSSARQGTKALLCFSRRVVSCALRKNCSGGRGCVHDAR